MSVETINCTVCDFHSASSVVWGRFAYELQGGESISLRRCLGWCSDCKSLRAIENLTKDSLRKATTELKAKVATLTNNIENANRGLSAFFGFAKTRIRRLARDRDFYQTKLLEATLYRGVLESRRSSARCLYCGTDKVISVELPDAPKNGSQLVTQFVHPECGGHLVVFDDGFRLALSFPVVRIYDSEGIFVREQEDGSDTL
jgi:hypothetical protein